MQRIPGGANQRTHGTAASSRAETVPFGVRTEVVELAIWTREGAVVRIDLGRYGGRPPRTPLERLVAGELRSFLRGARHEFTFPIQTCGTPFEERVWSEVRRIPFGATATYGAIARRVGQPGAARAVGSANGRNPIPIVIPCHRVVAAGGGLGGYGGGLPLKRRLLALEARTAGLHLELQTDVR